MSHAAPRHLASHTHAPLRVSQLPWPEQQTPLADEPGHVRCSQRAPPPQPSAHTGASCTTRASRGAGLGRASAAASLRTTLPFAVFIDATSIASSCSVAGAARAGPATKAAAAPGVTTSSHARRSSRSPGAAPAPMRQAVDCSRPCASGSQSHAAPTHPPSHAQRPSTQRPWACSRRARRVASRRGAPRQPNSHAQVALRQRPWSEQSHVVGLRRSHAAPAHPASQAHASADARAAARARRVAQALRGLRDGLRQSKPTKPRRTRSGRRRRRRGRSKPAAQPGERSAARSGWRNCAGG